MSALVAFALACSIQNAQVDPNLLGIGRRGTVRAMPSQIVDTRSGKTATLADIAKAAQGKRFVYLGEEHATTAHQAMEASVIEALNAAGRKVIVGMEMYTRPKQDVLDLWSAGKLTEDEFKEQSDWKGQWGFDYDYYRPVFEAVKAHQLPLVALNVPRDWVRTMTRKGYSGLPTSARLQLPSDIDLGNKAHREIFDALVGPHAMPGVSADGMYGSQVLWDTAMADTALKYLALAPATPGTVFVVIAGSGHVLYGQGINYRVEKRRGGRGITIAMLESDTPVEVSRGIADFVFVSPKPVTKG